MNKNHLFRQTQIIGSRLNGICLAWNQLHQSPASPLRRHHQQGRSLIMDDRAIHGFDNQTGTWTHGRTYPWSWFQTFRNFPVVRCLSHKNWNIISSPCFTEQQLKSYVTWQFVETISLPRRVDFSTSQPFPAHLLLIQPACQEASLFFTNHSLQQLLFKAQSQLENFTTSSFYLSITAKVYLGFGFDWWSLQAILTWPTSQTVSGSLIWRILWISTWWLVGLFSLQYWSMGPIKKHHE